MVFFVSHSNLKVKPMSHDAYDVLDDYGIERDGVDE